MCDYLWLVLLVEVLAGVGVVSLVLSRWNARRKFKAVLDKLTKGN